VLVFSYIVMIIMVYIPMIIFTLPAILRVVRMGSGADYALRGIGYLIALVVIAFLQAGHLRMILDAARGRQPTFGELFSGGDRFVPMLGTFFITALAVWFGFLLLIVPGVILALGLGMSSYFVVDQGLSPVDAMKASWQATTGHKMKLFLFGIVGFFIVLGSEIACCLPVLAAIPVLGLAAAIVYLRITGRGGPAPRGYGPPGGAPPGYGPPGGGPAGFGGPGAPGGYGGPGAPGGYGGPGAPGGYGPPGGGGGYGPPGGQGGPGGPGGGRPPGY
jgi:hypothetical protein